MWKTLPPVISDVDTRIIVDGNMRWDGLGVDDYDIISIPKADDTVPQVMAASILGKCFRDDLMTQLHNEHPEYQIYEWNKNWGYPVARHLQAIKDYGITPLHRMSYKPMKLL